MKKKDIDLFGILLGLIIGAILGYLIFSQIGQETDDPENEVINTNLYGTVYLLQVGRSASLDDFKMTQNVLKTNNHYSEVVTVDGLYYLYSYLTDSLEKAQTKKIVYESLGITVTIKSDYIMDLPNSIITGTLEHGFYTDAILILLKSIEGSPFEIPDKYNITPVNVEVFSSMTMLFAIKNEIIKEQIQLNMYCSLIKKLK